VDDLLRNSSLGYVITNEKNNNNFVYNYNTTTSANGQGTIY